MNIEFSKEQKEALAKKVDLCVEFLKIDVQPYLGSKDNIVLNMGDLFDLCLTKTSMYVKQTRVWDLNFIEIPLNKIFYLEKDRQSTKKAKQYICTAAPALAVEFLKRWEKAKYELLDKVNQKNAEVMKLDKLIDDFKV